MGPGGRIKAGVEEEDLAQDFEEAWKGKNMGRASSVNEAMISSRLI